jgi:hypothetical protein
MEPEASRNMTLKASTGQMKISYRQGIRLYRSYRDRGDAGLRRGSGGKPPNRKTAAGTMAVLSYWIKTYKIPQSLYCGRKNAFVRTHDPADAGFLAGTSTPGSHFGKARGKLGIEAIRKVSRFLRETRLPAMNRKFTRPAVSQDDAHVPLLDADLTGILCFEYEQRAANDYTVRFETRLLQILKEKRKYLTLRQIYANLYKCKVAIPKTEVLGKLVYSHVKGVKTVPVDSALVALINYFPSECGNMHLFYDIDADDYIKNGKLDIFKSLKESKKNSAIFNTEFISLDKDLENKLKNDPPFDIIRYSFERWDKLFQAEMAKVFQAEGYPKIQIKLQSSLEDFLRDMGSPHVFYNNAMQCYQWSDIWKTHSARCIYHASGSIFDLYSFLRMKQYRYFFFGYEIILYKDFLDKINKTNPIYPLTNTKINELPYLSRRLLHVDEIVRHKNTKEGTGLSGGIFRRQRDFFYYLFIIKNLPRNKTEEANGKKEIKTTPDKWLSLAPLPYEKIGEEFLREIFIDLEKMVKRKTVKRKTVVIEKVCYYWFPGNVDWLTESIPNFVKNTNSPFDTIVKNELFNFDKLLGLFIGRRFEDVTKKNIEINRTSWLRGSFIETEIKDGDGKSTGEKIRDSREISFQTPIGDEGTTIENKIGDEKYKNGSDEFLDQEYNKKNLNTLNLLAQIAKDKFIENFCRLLWEDIIKTIRNQSLPDKHGKMPGEQELIYSFLVEMQRFLTKGKHNTDNITHKALNNIYNLSECRKKNCKNLDTCRMIMVDDIQQQNTNLRIKIKQKVWRGILMDSEVKRNSDNIREALGYSLEEFHEFLIECVAYKNKIITKKAYKEYVKRSIEGT